MRYLLILIALIFAGCAEKDESPHWVAEVTSTTSWSGAFGNRSVDGRGNDTVDLGEDEIVCCVVQKITEGGSLRVAIRNTTNNRISEEATTTAAYGVVSVCSN